MLDIEYQPGITLVAIEKNHNILVQSLCADKYNATGESHNIPAGTTIYFGITRPSVFDFFLCSHRTAQVKISYYFCSWYALFCSCLLYSVVVYYIWQLSVPLDSCLL